MADRAAAGPHLPVLIVGGGVTGLSAALFLAWYGVPAVLVERRQEPVADPRARALDTGTGTGALSPCGWAAIDQDQLEPLLRDRAVAAVVDVRCGTCSASAGRVGHDLAQGERLLPRRPRPTAAGPWDRGGDAGQPRRARHPCAARAVGARR